MAYVFMTGVAPHDFKYSIFATVPRGSEPEDQIESGAREAGNWRPLFLKNTDAKLIASCPDRTLQRHVKTLTHEVQRGFTPGRNFVDLIPAMDA
eukprot:9257846-Pyramimonas_sp.AAC.1